MALVIFRRAGIALVIAMFCCVLGLSAWYGGIAAWSDVLSLPTRWQIEQWRSGKGPVYKLARWEEHRNNLQIALRVTPNNAQLHDDLAFLYAARALGMGTPAEGTSEYSTRQSLLRNAIVNYQISTELRPTFPYSWAYLAFAQHQQGEKLQILLPAFDKAQRYGSTEPDIRTVLAKIAFSHWEAMDAVRKGKIISMISSSPKDAQKALKKLAAERSVGLPES